MANMSYCKFRNTLSDFRYCCESIHDDSLSAEEHNARRLLILEMVDVLTDIGAEIDDDFLDEGLMEKK
jgi:hypothetical protein